MSTASMTFGRPARMTIPRGSLWMASLAFYVIEAVRRLDRWQLSRQEQEPTTPDEVMDYARRIESTDPGFAADLRAAALRAQGAQDL
jgi:hypothetical protein